MKQLGGFCLLFSLAIQNCRPAAEPYLREVALNFKETGFLTADILQVHCKQQLHPQETINRESLLEHCRNTMLETIFQYRAHSELNRRSLLQTAKPLPPWSYQISFTKEQKQKLTEIYSDLLPGMIVYEELTATEHRAVYRLQRNNLAQTIQSRPLPFRIEIAPE